MNEIAIPIILFIVAFTLVVSHFGNSHKLTKSYSTLARIRFNFQKLVKYSFSFCLILLFFTSCKTQQDTSQATNEPKVKKEPIFTINNTYIYPEELLYAYEKSNKNKGSSEPIEDYLDLYINFKLKVEDAKKAGLDTLPSYKNELKGYLEDIKKPYLTSEKVNEELLQETYQRLQNEINASHILIRVEEADSPTDTLEAYNKIKELREKALAGDDFGQLAQKYSEDPSARSNQGDLGWFTAFQMVYPFESAAYKTGKGEVSEIIRTKFGYHIVKVNEKRETLGRIKLAHIMLRFPPKADEKDSANVFQKINKISEELEQGEDWFALAAKYSEDLNTKDQGGSLPWFGAGNLPSALEQVAFELIQFNEISEPVQSPYGWHILKLEEKRGVGSLESMEESLTRRIQRDQRSELKLTEVLESLKKENKFKRNELVYSWLKSNSTLHDSLKASVRKNEVLFYISDQSYSVSDFFANSAKNAPVESALSEYERTKLLEYENQHLPEKYPEYRLLANEYRDGLLLFEIMSREVWDKVSSDSTGLRNYFEERKDDFKTKSKVVADLFLFNDTSNINFTRQLNQNGFYPLNTPVVYENKTSLSSKLKELKVFSDTIYVQLKRPTVLKATDSTAIYSTLQSTFINREMMKPIYSEENKIYLQLYGKPSIEFSKIYKGLIAAEQKILTIGEKENGMVIPEKPGYYQAFNNEGKLQILQVKRILKSLPRTFEEAKPDLISEYQNFLESRWIEQLNKENTVKVNTELLEKLKSEFESENL